MTFRLLTRLLVAAVFAAAAGSVFCQTVYDGEKGKLPLSFGGGVSNFDPDFTQGFAPGNQIIIGDGFGRLWGVTGWADAGLRFGPSFIHPFNVELQIRSIFAGGSAGQGNLKETTLGGGATYTWRHFPRFRPYGKYIGSIGLISFSPVPYPGHPPYAEDSRFTNAVGGGFDYRLNRRVWVRADYEYQLWGNLFGPREFSPQGVTLGLMYHLNKFPYSHY